MITQIVATTTRIDDATVQSAPTVSLDQTTCPVRTEDRVCPDPIWRSNPAAPLRTHAQLRATCGMLWRAWSDGVVPLRVELVALDIEARHLLVANLDPLRIAPRVQHAVHGQPARRRGRGNQIHDGRMADERTASPSLGDVAEQAMLDRVPLRGSGWIVADRDR